MKRGKRYLDLLKRYDRTLLYSPLEAVELVKALASARFDETVEMAVKLGIDPRRSDQLVRGSLTLPHGSGKNVRVAVFASGAEAEAAKAAGADIVGADDLVEKIQKEGALDFDVAIATPEMMPQVGKLGRILGPRGLMPNPKAGTVTQDVAKAVKEFKSGRVEYRSDSRTGVVHVPIGKASFPVRSLLENFKAVVDELQRAKPPAAKGRYFRSVALSSTMGPGIKVDPNRVRVSEEELEQAA